MTSQGLGQPAQVSLTGRVSEDAFRFSLARELELDLRQRLRLPVPRVFSQAVVERAHYHRLPERFGALYRGVWPVVDTATDEGGDPGVSEIVKEVTETSLEAIDKGVRAVEKSLRIVTYAAPPLLLSGHPTAAAAAAAPELIPRSVESAAVAAFHRVFKGNRIPWVFWRAQQSRVRVERDLKQMGIGQE